MSNVHPNLFRDKPWVKRAPDNMCCDKPCVKRAPDIILCDTLCAKRSPEIMFRDKLCAKREPDILLCAPARLICSVLCILPIDRASGCYLYNIMFSFHNSDKRCCALCPYDIIVLPTAIFPHLGSTNCSSAQESMQPFRPQDQACPKLPLTAPAT